MFIYSHYVSISPATINKSAMEYDGLVNPCLKPVPGTGQGGDMATEPQWMKGWKNKQGIVSELGCGATMASDGKRRKGEIRLWWYCEKYRSSTNSYRYNEVYSLKTLVMKCCTKPIINFQWNPMQAASTASLHMIALCIMYLLPAELGLEAFSALGGKKSRIDLTNSWSLHHLKVLTEVLSKISNKKWKHFQFCGGSAFSELPYLHGHVALRSQLHFQLCQSEASSCCCKGVVWSSSCCLSCGSTELVPLHTTHQGKQILRAARKHWDIWIVPSQRDPAAGEAMHRRRRLVLKQGNAVWNRIQRTTKDWKHIHWRCS